MRITSITSRTVLNSLAQPTAEFVVELDDGSRGFGSAPEGETRGIWEDRPAVGRELTSLLEGLAQDDTIRSASGQTAVDSALSDDRLRLPSNVSLGISVAYLHASASSHGISVVEAIEGLAERDPATVSSVPILLLNVLNGGPHARTNPVLSDFPEFLLVPVAHDVWDYLGAFHEFEAAVRQTLATLDRTVVGGGVVHAGAANDNRTWIELLIELLDRLGLGSDFGVMIDASAGDLCDAGLYRFSRTDGSIRDRDEMVGYWVELCSTYGLAMLEDPLAEEDRASWISLNRATSATTIVGDNLCSTDPDRIRQAGDEGLVGATLIKPNQAGTVTRTLDAVRAARQAEIRPIPSHRSIETDIPWLADLCIALDIDMAKLGLISDFATIQKLNRMLRYHTARSARPGAER